MATIETALARDTALRPDTAAPFAEVFKLEQATLTTFDRQQVAVGGQTWVWRSRPNAGSRYKCDFEKMYLADALLTPESLQLIRWWVAYLLRTRSGSTAIRHARHLRLFCRWRRSRLASAGGEPLPLDFGNLTAEELIAFNEWLIASRRKSKRLPFSDIRRMLQRVVPRAPQCFQSGLVEAISPVGASRPRQGHAVRSRDPEKGALTSGERYALRKAVDNGLGPELQRSLVRICLETGIYPLALSDLRADEIEHEEVETLDRATGRYTVVKHWVLRRLRVKKRTEKRETRDLYVTDATGEALDARRRSVDGEWLFPEVRTDHPGADPV